MYQQITVKFAIFLTPQVNITTNQTINYARAHTNTHAHEMLAATSINVAPLHSPALLSGFYLTHLNFLSPKRSNLSIFHNNIKLWQPLKLIANK